MTSITSKKVRLHLMYALLTYCLVMLGSMGTCEDLFYKCCAPLEEIVHFLHFSGNFSLKTRKLTMRIVFLDNYSINHSICWPIIAFAVCIWLSVEKNIISKLIWYNEFPIYFRMNYSKYLMLLKIWYAWLCNLLNDNKRLRPGVLCGNQS